MKVWIKGMMKKVERYEITGLLPSSLILYIFHTPLQSPHIDYEQANANMVGIS